jgi:hypothetical protein
MKKTKLPNLVSILILTLITAVMWISLNIYSAITSTPSPVVQAEVSEPLNPVLDIEVISQIESRLYLDDSQIPENIVAPPTGESITITGTTLVTEPASAPAEIESVPEPEPESTEEPDTP